MAIDEVQSSPQINLTNDHLKNQMMIFVPQYQVGVRVTGYALEVGGSGIGKLVPDVAGGALPKKKFHKTRKTSDWLPPAFQCELRGPIAYKNRPCGMEGFPWFPKLCPLVSEVGPLDSRSRTP